LGKERAISSGKPSVEIGRCHERRQEMNASRWQTGVVAVAIGVLTGLAYGADGQATLSIDQRGRPAPDNFGFAFMENVQRSSPGGATFTDACQTLPKPGDNATLVAMDGVASSENPEPILRIVGKDANGNNAPDTVTFTGRTGDCYYMVSGNYVSNGGTTAQSGPGQSTGGPGWTADFDTNSDTTHFVVYINDRYRSDDDCFFVDRVSTVYVEVANPKSTSTIGFRLSQQTLSEDGVVQILQDDGVTPEPIRPDGTTEKIYTIQPDTSQPNGPRVPIMVKGLSGSGLVSIIVTEAQ
jgi:hypothetical protein